MYTLILLAEETGLTLERVISDIPLDPASITIHVLVAISMFVIWWGSRNSGKEPTPPIRPRGRRRPGGRA